MAAFSGDGGDARETLNVGGCFKALTIGAESGQQAGSEGCSGPGETVKQGVIGMLLEQGLDEPVELSDAAQQGLQLLDQTADHQAHGPNDSRVHGQRLSGSNLSDPLVEALEVSAVMGPIELPDLAGSRGL